jgi:hypothetical protein
MSYISANIAHCQVVAVSRPIVTVRALSLITSSFNAAPLVAYALTQLAAVAFCQPHQTLPDIVLLSCEQTGFTE